VVANKGDTTIRAIYFAWIVKNAPRGRALYRHVKKQETRSVKSALRFVYQLKGFLCHSISQISACGPVASMGNPAIATNKGPKIG